MSGHGSGFGGALYGDVSDGQEEPLGDSTLDTVGFHCAGDELRELFREERISSRSCGILALLASVTLQTEARVGDGRGGCPGTKPQGEEYSVPPPVYEASETSHVALPTLSPFVVSSLPATFPPDQLHAIIADERSPPNPDTEVSRISEGFQCSAAGTSAGVTGAACPPEEVDGRMIGDGRGGCPGTKLHEEEYSMSPPVHETSETSHATLPILGPFVAC